MKKIPKKIDNIIRSGSILIDKGARYITYYINEDKEDEKHILIKLPEYYRPEITKEIIDDTNSFVNGYKVVQTSNGEYAYIRESDNTLLPFRYDIASDFNQFGFAMVAKDGSVSWINKDFKYLNLDGEMVKEDSGIYRNTFNGWQGVSDFSNGDIPLSRVYDGRNSYGRVAYFNTEGELKKFYKYDGKISKYANINFMNGTSFDKDGHAFADCNLLFANGYYISYSDLVKLSIDKGFADTISKEVEKVLIKKENNRKR